MPSDNDANNETKWRWTRLLGSSQLPSPSALSRGRILSASSIKDTDICLYVTLSPPEWIFTLRAVGVIPQGGTVSFSNPVW